MIMVIAWILFIAWSVVAFIFSFMIIESITKHSFKHVFFTAQTAKEDRKGFFWVYVPWFLLGVFLFGL